jgi:hypothetical protein
MRARPLILLAALVLFITPSFAQQPPEATQPLPTEASAAAIPPEQAPPAALAADAAAAAVTPPATEFLPGEDASGAPVFSDEQYGSLVFTYWEHVAIKDMKNARGDTRAVTEAELKKALDTKEDITKKVKPPPEEREIRLGGIAYHGSNDWTIWLNEKRVSPDAIPKEAMDLKVYKGYIEMKWFDEWSNQIYPIRLRPHQRFNLDARMFLPG